MLELLPPLRLTRRTGRYGEGTLPPILQILRAPSSSGPCPSLAPLRQQTTNPRYRQAAPDPGESQLPAAADSSGPTRETTRATDMHHKKQHSTLERQEELKESKITSVRAVSLSKGLFGKSFGTASFFWRLVNCRTRLSTSSSLSSSDEIRVESLRPEYSHIPRVRAISGCTRRSRNTRISWSPVTSIPAVERSSRIFVISGSVAATLFFGHRVPPRNLRLQIRSGAELFESKLLAVDVLVLDVEPLRPPALVVLREAEVEVLDLRPDVAAEASRLVPPLALHAEDAPPQHPMGFDPQKALAKRDKTRDLQH